MERLEQEKGVLEQQIAEEEKRHRQEMRKWERKIKASEEKLDGLQKELRDKEQENRISKLKIKEMRRLLKHNQLRPLQPVQQVPEEQKVKNSIVLKLQIEQLAIQYQAGSPKSGLRATDVDKGIAEQVFLTGANHLTDESQEHEP